MSITGKQIQIAVVIATKNRLQLLSERAVPSVLAQTHSPSRLLVVDDSDSEVRVANAGFVRSLTVSGCEISYLENARTCGASGSWNTAIDHLTGGAADPSELFVAFLDDDDSWDPSYLEQCLGATNQGQIDMVAADFRRHESTAAPPTLATSPSALDAADFLTSNPGIQGSNLFVRLSTLLSAGGFDEALASTTDRDLCVRIADLGTVRYARLPVGLVDHFADSDRSRLSTPASPAKLAGLSAFWRKHHGRMTAEQRRMFTERASRLFGWRLPVDPFPAPSAGVESFTRRRSDEPVHPCVSDLPPQRIEIAPKSSSFHLFIGVITGQPCQLRIFLRSLGVLRSLTCLRAVTALVLDNGCPHAELEAVICESRADGLSIAVIDEARQHTDAAAGGFGAAFGHRPRGHVEIARARTMLQRYLGQMMGSEPGSVGWILDDDMRLDDRARAYLPLLPDFRASGVDVLLGSCEGSSPNTALHGLRVQLVDLLYNLRWLEQLGPDTVLPDRSRENSELRARFPDYYYDLSRKHSAHLEMPFWVEPSFNGETVRDARARLLADSLGLFRGAPLTRPLITEMPSTPLTAAQDSVNRGGCTFVLNHRALTETPNLIASVRGGEARRSDMVWAIVNRFYRRMTIKSVGFPVLHLARGSATPPLDVRKAQAELIGSTLYSALACFLRAHSHHQLDFSDAEADAVCRIADANLSIRWRMLEQSLRRIAGLRESLRRIWPADGYPDFLACLDAWIAPETLGRLRSGIEAYQPQETRRFVCSLRAYADDFAASSVNIDFIHSQRSGATGGAVREMA